MTLDITAVVWLGTGRPQTAQHAFVPRRDESLCGAQRRIVPADWQVREGHKCRACLTKLARHVKASGVIR